VTLDARELLLQLQQRQLTRLDLGDVRVRITHPDRVLWPASGDYPAMSRRDLLRYFVSMADFLLPYMHDRPLTLLRYPTGLLGKHFFQKHVEFEPPPFVHRECLISEHTGIDGVYLFCNNLATLVWLAQMANIELHTWYSRIDNAPDARGLPHSFGGTVEAFEASVLNYPDFMVFDLDPYIYSGREPPRGQPEPHREGFERTCQATLWLKEVLDELRLPSFVKGSGKSGLHIFVPIQRDFDYDAVRAMSEQICRFVLGQHPNELTMDWSVDRRRGKVFLDHNQNTRGKTLATPYSPRALPGGPVSMPLRWGEVGKTSPDQFTVRNALPRLHEVGDLWRDILDHKADLSHVFGALS
jgi:bifunctional non-homologous end joining protein LigD